MEIIEKNPFRILGLFANSSEKELQKNKSKIKAYSKVGKTIIFDTDFPFLPVVNRTDNMLNYAYSKLQQNRDKVHYGLFWFLLLTPADEIAIRYLRTGNIEKAKEIWAKLISDGNVTSENYSAFNNLGTLLLVSSNKEELHKGLLLKIQLIISKNFVDYVTVVTDKTFSMDNKHQLNNFIDETIKELGESLEFDNSEIISLFKDFDQQIKDTIIDKICSKLISNIEILIESTKKKRKENKSEAYEYGIKLYNNTKNDFNIISEILDNKSIKYGFIADNLAKEILQCGIDYFNYWSEHYPEFLDETGIDIDPDVKALELFEIAEKIAVSSIVKDRIKENTTGIMKWIETKQQIEKEKLVEDELAFLAEQINLYKNIDQVNNLLEALSMAEKFVDNCTPKLNSIKNILGDNDEFYDTDEFYIEISSIIATIAQNIVISVLNTDAKKMMMLSQGGIDKLYLLRKHKVLVLAALKVARKIRELDMSPELKKQFNENYEELNSLLKNIEKAEMQATRDSCYIATMVYGKYDHPKVIMLKELRDKKLKKNIIGIIFIRFYYRISPIIVEKLKGHDTINLFIKVILDSVLDLLSKEVQ